MTIVSYTQYSLYSRCPQNYKFEYVDKLGVFTTNIFSIFGTSMHETLQEYLKRMYEKDEMYANQLEMPTLLKERMAENFRLSKNRTKGEAPCTKKDLIEFWKDGLTILEWFEDPKNRAKYYQKIGWTLIGIELPLDIEIVNGVNYSGMLDVVLKNDAGQYKIIDIKTSTMGWNKYAKTDKLKNQQLVLYKKFFSDYYNVPLKDIDVEFHILKRKLYENVDFQQYRFQRHVPANGSVSTKRAYTEFMDFVNVVFDEEGNRRDTIKYPKAPGKNKKNCTWCGYVEICDQKAG